METLESSRVCRLCGQQSGISINIFDESESHVRKINAVLPIMVRCSRPLLSLSLCLSLRLSAPSLSLLLRIFHYVILPLLSEGTRFRVPRLLALVSEG